MKCVNCGDDELDHQKGNMLCPDGEGGFLDDTYFYPEKATPHKYEIGVCGLAKNSPCFCDGRLVVGKVPVCVGFPIPGPGGMLIKEHPSYTGCDYRKTARVMDEQP